MRDDEIARLCHEANRALQAILGDEMPSQPWNAEEEWVRQSVISGVMLARSGVTPEMLHQAWCADRENRGWVHGEQKNYDRKTHPCLLPYSELPEADRIKDRLFLAIVRELS